MRRTIVFALVAVLLLVTGGVAQSLVEPEPVVAGRGIEFNGFSNDTYLMFTRWTKAKGYVALARPLAGGEVTRLNAEGTGGITGGIDPGTNRVIYEQSSDPYGTHGTGDLYFYDLDAGERSEVPDVNTRLWEYRARISSTFIMFMNDRRRGGDWHTRLFVYDRGSGVTRKIGEWKGLVAGLEPGSVGDRYATYTRCGGENCSAYIYDWEADTTQRIPSVNDKPQFAPVLDEVNGAVYFARSGKAGEACGRNVGVWQLPFPFSADDVATKVIDLPKGIDMGLASSLAVNGETGHMDLYFLRWDCEADTGDLYVARGVDA